MSTEREQIALLAEVFARHRTGVRLGIGDDAAILDGLQPGELLVASVDACVEGVHFERAWLSLADIGFRAVMSAASDLAAMRARPLAALAAWTLPELSDAEVRELAEGEREACELLGMPMCGGNLARGAALTLTITVLGATRRPLTRAGARPGETLGVAGALGRAAAGLACLRRGIDRPDVASCVRAWRRPVARLDVLAALEEASAAIDVSDGLARDAGELARQSAACIVLDEDALGDVELAPAAAATGEDPRSWVLHGGEDYAVLATFAGGVPDPFRAIGRVEAGRGLRSKTGEIEPRGFDHFDGSSARRSSRPSPSTGGQK